MWRIKGTKQPRSCSLWIPQQLSKALNYAKSTVTALFWVGYSLQAHFFDKYCHQNNFFSILASEVLILISRNIPNQDSGPAWKSAVADVASYLDNIIYISCPLPLCTAKAWCLYQDCDEPYKELCTWQWHLVYVQQPPRGPVGEKQWSQWFPEWKLKAIIMVNKLYHASAIKWTLGGNACNKIHSSLRVRHSVKVHARSLLVQ